MMCWYHYISGCKWLWGHQLCQDSRGKLYSTTYTGAMKLIPIPDVWVVVSTQLPYYV